MTVEKSFKTAEKIQAFGWSLAKVEDFGGAYSRIYRHAQAAIGRGSLRLDGKATENNERLLRRPVALNYVFITGSLEVEVVSAVTKGVKGLNIAGMLNIVKLLLLTIYLPCPVLARTNVAIGMQFQAHNSLEKLVDAWAL